tara:strand:+ start:242 stop:427 length:186 start_codon:yes stop_codon:yes gene_type:complete
MEAASNNNRFDFNSKKNATTKEIFEKKSMWGIIVAGKTSKLDNIYINLLSLNKENILLKLI